MCSFRVLKTFQCGGRGNFSVCAFCRLQVQLSHTEIMVLTVVKVIVSILNTCFQ